MTERAEVRVTLAEDVHAQALADFFRVAWNSDASADAVRRATAHSAATNPVEPGVAPPSVLALQNERVIGFVGSLPARFWNGTAELPGYWVKGLMVLPEFQGGPIGFLVLREATRRMARTGAMVVAPPARRLFGALGYRDVGVISNYVRVLRGAKLARRIDIDALGIERVPAVVRKLVPLTQRIGIASVGGMLLSGTIRLRAAWARSGDRDHEIANAALPPQPDLDGLWLAGRPALRAAAVRDGVKLDLRYGTTAGAEGAHYRFASVRKNGRLVGVAAVRAPGAQGDPRLAGIAMATLSDAWFDPASEPAGLATLGAAELMARALGADALLCSTGHPALVDLLRRQGYLRAGGNMHLLFRDATETAKSWPPELEQWWVSRGDARSDDTF